MARLALVVAAFVVLLGCQRKAAPVAIEAAALASCADDGGSPPEAAAAAATATARATEEPPPDASVPADAPYAELPELDAEPGPSLFGGRLVGFSDDDRSLVHEISTCDPCPSAWTIVTPGAPDRHLAHFWDPRLESDVQERVRAKNDAKVDAELKKLGIAPAREGRHLRGPFPYPGLTFATKTTRDAATGRVTLHFGGRFGEDEPVYPMKVTLGPHPQWAVPASVRAGFASLSPAERTAAIEEWHDGNAMYDPTLAYANVTKNGKEIGIVVIGGGNYWYEAAGVARMPTDAFVARIRRR